MVTRQAEDQVVVGVSREGTEPSGDGVLGCPGVLVNVQYRCLCYACVVCLSIVIINYLLSIDSPGIGWVHNLCLNYFIETIHAIYEVTFSQSRYDVTELPINTGVLGLLTSECEASKLIHGEVSHIEL